MTFPTLAQIEDANWDYLTANATAWTDLATRWESAFTEIRDSAASPGGTPWTGAGAEAFQQRAAADVVTVHGPADLLRNAAAIANRGYETQVAAKGLVLAAVDAAEREDFQVGDDYSVTDTYAYYTSAAEQAEREQAAQGHASFIKSRAANLVANEDAIARSLTTATAGLHDFGFGDDGADGGAGGSNGQPRVVLVDDVHRDPTISGPATKPQHEQNGYDLQDQFQDGQGPIFGGDPRDGVPRSPASELAQGPPGTRPLPTGTALGPDGHRYGFFSNAPNTPPTDDSINPFVSNGSVWDYTDPAHPVKVGDLPGIFQASGVYDPATGQMVVIGNTSAEKGDLTRGMWMSAPVDPARPNDWVNTLQRVPGAVGLAGDRESQLIALGGGGYLLVGATNDGPVSAITASTPQGLIGAVPQPLLSQGDLPTVYGPTVMGTSLDPVTGLETIQMRVSTWPPGPIYDPNTWTTTFEVQH